MLYGPEIVDHFEMNLRIRGHCSTKFNSTLVDANVKLNTAAVNAELDPKLQPDFEEYWNKYC